MVELRIFVDRSDLRLVEQLDAGNRNPALDRRNNRVHRTFDIREPADCGRDRFGNSVKPDSHLGNYSQGAFRSDKQPGQVVAGRRFAGPPRCANYPAVGEHDCERQDVFPHRPVSHRVGPRGTRRRHPAQRCIGTGIDREKQAGVAQMLIELLAGDTRLDGGVEIFGVDPQDVVHLRQVDAYAARQRRDVPLQRGPRAEGDHRRLMLGTKRNDRGDFLGGAREGDGIRRMRGVVGFVLPVTGADRCRGRKPIPKELAQGGEQSRVEGFASKHGGG